MKEIRQDNASGALLASMLYDDNGNMTSKAEGATTTALNYDALNRLASVGNQNYTYDDQGRRIAKTVGTVTTNYLYNGPDIYGEYGSWANTSALYTHGPNTDDPIIRATATAAQYYHQDGLGSVVALSNAAGGTDGTQRFDAWGTKLTSTGTIPQYGYTGREPDETGLIYYRARYYDPTIGRFTQRDPIGLGGGINQFAYVGGNPVNFVDPMGLTPQGPVLFAENTYVNTGSDASSGMISSGSQNLPSSVQADKDSNTGLKEDWGAYFIAAGITQAATKGLIGLASGISTTAATEGAGVITGAYGQVTRSTLQTLAEGGGPTTSVFTQLTQAPISGQALSVATGSGAEALANAARTTGQLFSANLPTRLIVEMQRVGLVESRTTIMNGVRAAELRFMPQATEFITHMFK